MTTATENRFARVTKPMTELVLLNAETTGTVLARQNAFVADVIAASVDQVRVLTEAGSLRDAIDSQRTYVREIGEKFQATARENVETIRAAGRDAGTVVRGAFRRAETDVKEAIDDARTEAAVAIDNVAGQIEDAVAPAAEPAPAQF